MDDIHWPSLIAAVLSQKFLDDPGVQEQLVQLHDLLETLRTMGSDMGVPFLYRDSDDANLTLMFAARWLAFETGRR